MTTADAAMLLGALVPTFLLSRLLLLLTRAWSNRVVRLGLAHVSSAIFCSVASAFGHADGSELDWSSTGIYLGAQLVWFVVDLFRYQRNAPQISN